MCDSLDLRTLDCPRRAANKEWAGERLGEDVGDLSTARHNTCKHSTCRADHQAQVCGRPKQQTRARCRPDEAKAGTGAHLRRGSSCSQFHRCCRTRPGKAECRGHGPRGAAGCAAAYSAAIAARAVTTDGGSSHAGLKTEAAARPKHRAASEVSACGCLVGRPEKHEVVCAPRVTNRGVRACAHLRVPIRGCLLSLMPRHRRARLETASGA